MRTGARSTGSSADVGQYRLLVDAIPQLIWVAGPDGALDYLNRRCVEFTGRPLDDLLGGGWQSVVHPDDLPATLDRWGESVRTGVLYEGECRLRRADGAYRWFAGRAEPQRDDAGRVVRWVGVCTDIQDRKEAEAARARSDALLRAVWDDSAEGKRLADADGTVVLANPAYCRLVGRPPEEVIGQPLAHTHAPAGRAVALRRHRDRFATRAARHREEVEVELVGGPRWFEVTDRFLDLPGEPPLMLSVFRDVTARRLAEAELLQARDRLRHVVASSPAVLFTLLVDGGAVRGIGWVSDNLREMLGYAPEAAYHPDWWLEHIHPDDRDRVIAQTHADLFGPGRAFGEYRFRHRDGTYRWTRGEIRLVRDAAGRVVEAVGSWTDVTDRKRLEEQLRQAQKMEAVGRLAGGVAHDFNNVLTVVTGCTELLLEGLPAGHPVRPLAEEVRDAGDRAAALTRQLLAFSRKQVLAPRPLDLNALLAELQPVLARTVGEGVAVDAGLAPDLGPVFADPGAVEQMVLNLAVNARDAMPRGGRLTIETRVVDVSAEVGRVKPGRYARMTVADTGAGIPADVLPRVFDPFFTTKPVGRGTGLGLAVVHGAVTQAGGYVEAQSEPGRGAAFHVYLPLAARPAPAADPPRSHDAPPPTGTETLLLVEDERAVRALAAGVLRRAGYTVLEAGGGEEALAAAGAHAGPLHLLVTDVSMPGLNGRELAERLTAARLGVRVLYMSGYTDDVVVRQGVADRVPFLPKPFTPAALARKVRDVLDGA